MKEQIHFIFSICFILLHGFYSCSNKVEPVLLQGGTFSKAVSEARADGKGDYPHLCNRWVFYVRIF
ncbi:hypothetical protein M472_15395 [Sphingobacterium paucimobilis HER1398]|uniref:Uncharacterized protein n=1 Tax=Sphingobacterium paucimobilis HER1398 TaxID=1346330 RepID=U2HX84_9SPHI|nr:hypothetical protein M472_15395 [Sphingobacterium paucimobilis HER1398]